MEKRNCKKGHCRFNFPFPENGFKVDLNEDVEPPEIEGIEPDLKQHNDTIGDLLRYGASYQKHDPIDTRKMIQTSLELLRKSSRHEQSHSRITINMGSKCGPKDSANISTSDSVHT